MRHASLLELEQALPDIRRSPADGGTVEMIVARPDVDVRVQLDKGRFEVDAGLVGDNWRSRGSRQTDDGSAHPDMQIAMINRRFLELVAFGRDRWPLAGDQLVVDLDLSVGNIRPGQRLMLADVVLEVTPAPHNGCRKFTARFGRDAVAFTATEAGRELRLRGVYVRVVEAGTVRVGDTITKL